MDRIVVETVRVLLDDVSTLRLLSTSYRFLQGYVYSASVKILLRLIARKVVRSAVNILPQFRPVHPVENLQAVYSAKPRVVPTRGPPRRVW